MDSLNKLEEMISSFPLHFGKDLQQVLLSTVRQAKIEKEEYLLRSISWNVLDFEGRATHFQKEFPEKNYIFDENKFEDALQKMIKDHDATVGITWDTVDFYLKEYCLRSFERDDYESKLH